MSETKTFDSQTIRLAYLHALAEGLVSADQLPAPLTAAAGQLLHAAKKVVGEPADALPQAQALTSILTQIGNTVEKRYFQPQPLSIGPAAVFANTTARPTLGDWRDLQKSQFSRLATLSNSSTFGYTLFHWVYAQGSRVAASTGKYDDVSLFDRNRLLGAVVQCLGYEGMNLEKPKFILLKGAVSGIQDYIYADINLDVVGSTDRLAKRLRGRSFFVALLTEYLAEELTRQIGLEQANIIFAGGGHFNMLLPATEEVKTKIKHFEQEINLQLRHSILHSPSVVMGYLEAEADIFQDFGKYYIEVNDELERKKQRKFRGYLKRFFHAGEAESTPIQNDELTEKLGERIPYADYLFELHIKESERERFATLLKTNAFDPVIKAFAHFGTYYFLNDRNQNNQDYYIALAEKYAPYIESIRIIRLNQTDVLKDVELFGDIPAGIGFKFIGRQAPNQGGKLCDFEQLTEMRFDKDEPLSFLRLAIMRLDVDDLGAVFAAGLGTKADFLRIASISREMHLFFSGYFNQLAKDHQIYITYSGGDDAFVIGSWFNVLHFAEQLYGAFQTFTCGNNGKHGINFSAGVFLCDEHYPVARFADDAAEMLDDYAKRYKTPKGEPAKAEKNAITVFNHTLSWERFIAMMDVARQMNELVAPEGTATDGRKMKRSLAQRLLSILQSSRDNKDGILFYQNVARLHYLFARQGFTRAKLRKDAESHTNSSSVVENILRDFAQKEVFEDYTIPIHYTLYLTRNDKKR